VNSPPPETREEALEEFFAFHRAHNGKRRRDPTEFIEIVEVRRESGGWEHSTEEAAVAMARGFVQERLADLAAAQSTEEGR